MVPTAFPIALFSCLALLLLTYFGVRRKIKQFFPGYFLNTERLERARTDARPLVAILGNSAVQEGIYFDNRFESFAAQRGQALSFVRFTGRPLLLEAVEKFVAHILSSSRTPDLLIIQWEAIVWDSPRMRRIQSKYLPETYSLTGQLKWLFSKKQRSRRKKSRMANYGHKHQHENDQINLSQFDSFMKLQFADRRQRELPEFDGLANKISRLTQRGTQVAILSLGRCAAANEWLGKDFDINSLRAMNDFCEHNPITLFDPIVIDDSDLYRDPTHVNDEGAVIVSNHVLEQIAKLGFRDRSDLGR